MNTCYRCALPVDETDRENNYDFVNPHTGETEWIHRTSSICCKHLGLKVAELESRVKELETDWQAEILQRIEKLEQRAEWQESPT